MEVLEYFVNKCCGNVSLLSKVKQNHLQTIKARVFIRGDEPAKSANITTMKGAAVPPVLWKPASPCSAPRCQQPWCLSQLGLTFCLCQQPTLPASLLHPACKNHSSGGSKLSAFCLGHPLSHTGPTDIFSQIS